MLGLKQEALAIELGEDWNQKKVSLLESKEVVDDGLLEEVARVLKVPSEMIEKLTEEGAIQIIATTFNSHDNSTSVVSQSTLNFDPLDKYVEVVEKIEKLYKENKKLYEELLRVEREKNVLLERLINK